MASPFVTGTALLMRDANPSLTPAQVKTRIRASAVDWGLAGAGTTLGSRGPDLDFGWGRLDAYAALRAAGAPGLTSPPPVPDHRTFDGSMGAPQQVRDFPIEVKNRCLPIAASVIMPRWRGYDSQADGYVDYDIKLLDASKNVLAKGDSIERQDDYSYRPPSTGTYVVRVEDYTGSGPFFADVSAGLSAPPPGSPASCGPPSSP
jgi:serine protease AprX